MVRLLLSLTLFTSCASQTSQDAPSWVSSVRNAEERQKIQMGNRIFYRRVAGGPEVSKQTSCELVLFKIEEDLKRESPNNPKVPFTVESLYYDGVHKDCAATVSISTHQTESSRRPAQANQDVLRLQELKSKDHVSDDEVAEILSLRTEIAMKYAMTGLSVEEFQVYSKEKVSLIEDDGICNITFKSKSFSIHGDVKICWENAHVKGYCKGQTNQCWTRSPY